MLERDAGRFCAAIVAPSCFDKLSMRASKKGLILSLVKGEAPAGITRMRA